MRLRRRHPPKSVTFYTRQGCHLCTDARLLLERLSRRYPAVISDVDISTDPALYREYDIRIPVIVIDGAVTLEGRIEEPALRRALKTGG